MEIDIILLGQTVYQKINQSTIDQNRFRKIVYITFTYDTNQNDTVTKLGSL